MTYPRNPSPDFALALIGICAFIGLCIFSITR